MIKKFITDDKRVGYDKFNQLMLATRDGDNTSYHMISDLRRQKCELCLRGWEATGESLADQTRWRLTDAYVHETCLMRHIGFVERSEIHGAICGAGLRFEFERIADGSNDRCGRILPPECVAQFFRPLSSCRFHFSAFNLSANRINASLDGSPSTSKA